MLVTEIRYSPLPSRHSTQKGKQVSKLQLLFLPEDKYNHKNEHIIKRKVEDIINWNTEVKRWNGRWYLSSRMINLKTNIIVRWKRKKKRQGLEVEGTAHARVLKQSGVFEKCNLVLLWLQYTLGTTKKSLSCTLKFSQQLNNYTA